MSHAFADLLAESKEGIQAGFYNEFIIERMCENDFIGSGQTS